MRKIWQFIVRDAKHIVMNAVSLVVCVGMIVVPSFYAWFNIAGSWNPYDNTGNIKVALATNDEGYSSDLMPVEVNMGERIVSKLSDSTAIGYTVTSEDEAIEGVRSGKYYAAIVIPESFSRDMFTVLSDNPTHPQVLFYSNEKENAIASIVTDKASTSAQQTINETFSAAVVDVATSVLSQVGDYMDDDQVQSFAARLSQVIGDSRDQLGATADNVRSYQAIVASAADLLDSSSSNSSSSLAATVDAGGLLRTSASGIRDVDSALSGTTDSVNDALAKSKGSLSSVDSAIDDAFDAAGTQTDKAADALQNAKDIVDARTAELQGVYDSLDGDTATLLDKVISYEDTLDQTTVQYQRVHEVRLEVEGLNASLKTTIDNLSELSDELGKAKDDLSNSKTDAEASRAQLKALVSQAESGVDAVQQAYESDLGSSLGSLADQIDGLADGADGISSSIDATVSSLNSATGSARGNLDDLAAALGEAADALDDANDKLGGLDERLSAALGSGDIDQIRTILSAGPDSLAAFITEPVTMDRTAIFPVENNGSAMAPFYTVLAIWIGGVILCALVKTAPSEAAKREIGCRPWQAYFGRLAFFIVIGLMQTAVICLGDLYFLQIQCVHPGLFLLCGFVSSIVFVNVIYSLTASFGDVGKAIAVLLMVIQVAGSGGTFPKEMLPQAFQAVYPWLPFVHAENAMRAAIAGLYANDFWIELLALSAFIVPSLFLGLVLRKPVIRLNAWFERKLEETKIM